MSAIALISSFTSLMVDTAALNVVFSFSSFMRLTWNCSALPKSALTKRGELGLGGFDVSCSMTWYGANWIGLSSVSKTSNSWRQSWLTNGISGLNCILAMIEIYFLDIFIFSSANFKSGRFTFGVSVKFLFSRFGI